MAIVNILLDGWRHFTQRLLPSEVTAPTKLGVVPHGVDWPPRYSRHLPSTNTTVQVSVEVKVYLRVQGRKESPEHGKYRAGIPYRRAREAPNMAQVKM